MLENAVKVDKEKFYDMYVKMCKMHNFPPLLLNNIEEVFVHFKDNLLTHSCFLWNTGSEMCMIGFPLSNLALPESFREGCLTKLLTGIEEICKEKGYKLIWTTSATKRVIDSLEEIGYQKGDENVQTYIKVVS